MSSFNTPKRSSGLPFKPFKGKTLEQIILIDYPYINRLYRAVRLKSSAELSRMLKVAMTDSWRAGLINHIGWLREQYALKKPVKKCAECKEETLYYISVSGEPRNGYSIGSEFCFCTKCESHGHTNLKASSSNIEFFSHKFDQREFQSTLNWALGIDQKITKRYAKEFFYGKTA